MPKISSQDILLANILLCKNLDESPVLLEPDVLSDIQNQINSNLNWLSDNQLAVYIGMQIAKRKPFLSLNLATATAITLGIIKQHSKNINIAVSDLANILSNNSVLDDALNELNL